MGCLFSIVTLPFPSRGLVIQDLEVVCRVRDPGRHHHCRRRYLHGGHR